jgi:hypothetical protein
VGVSDSAQPATRGLHAGRGTRAGERQRYANQGVFDRFPLRPIGAACTTKRLCQSPRASSFPQRFFPAESPSHRSWQDSSPSTPHPLRQQPPSFYRCLAVSLSAHRGYLVSVIATGWLRLRAPIHALASAAVLVQHPARAPRGGARWWPALLAFAASYRSWRSEGSVVPASCTPFGTAGALVGSPGLARLTRRCSGPGCYLVLPYCVQLATRRLPVARGSRAAERQR